MSIVMAMMGMVPPDSHGQSTASNASNSCQTSGEDVLSGCPAWSGTWITR